MKKWLGLGLLIVIILGAVGLRFMTSSQPTAPETTVFHDTTTGTSLTYPKNITAASLSAQDTQDKILLRLQQASDREPPVLVTLRYEAGIRKAANVLRREPLDIILESIGKSYPERFPGYNKLSERKFEISSKPAAEVLFTYQKNQDQLKQHLVIIMRDDDTAIYLAMQAKATDFDNIDKQYFTSLRNSLRLE